MLGHLRSGVRSLELRAVGTGTRIELCSLLLDVRFSQVEYTMAQVDSLKECVREQQVLGDFLITDYYALGDFLITDYYALGATF